jgi:integrase
MPLRKIRAKKYSGIYEYFKAKDNDKVTIAYYFQYRDAEGNPKKPKLKAMSKDEALVEANAIKEEVRRQKKLLQQDAQKFQNQKKSKKFTLNDVSKLFFEGREVKSNTRDKSVYKLRIENTLGNKLINEISKEDLEKLQKNLANKKDPLANKTINATVDFVINILNYAYRNSYIDSVVANRLPKDKDRFIKKLDLPSKRGRAFTEKELNKLFDVLLHGDFEEELASNEQLYLLCKLLYFSGARPEAVLDLQVYNYDSKKQEITIKAMKGISSYQQPLNGEAVVLIENWIKKYDLQYEEYIFFPMQTYKRSGEGAKKQGANYEAIRGTARRYFDKLFNVGIPAYARLDRIGLYSLRRTGATRIYNAKGLVAASQFLHHTDIKTTLRYLDLKDDLKEAVNVL